MGNEDAGHFPLLPAPAEKNDAGCQKGDGKSETFQPEDAESLFWTVPLFFRGQKVKMKNFKFLIFNSELRKISTKWKFQKLRTQHSKFKIGFKGVG
jgi:hypothetical protein